MILANKYLRILILALFCSYFIRCDNRRENNIYVNNKTNTKYIVLRELYIYNYSIVSRKLSHYKVLFFIESSSIHVNKRKKIRNMWINLCLKMSCNYFFVIASKGILENLKNENKNDIIGIDIIDSYYNLTILTSNIYKYYKKYKLYSDFIIKIDDDIFPNIPIIIIYINIYINNLKISGYYYKRIKTTRDISSSNYLPTSIYPFKFFPNFVAGGFVITPTHLIYKLYKELSKERRIINREDMHMAIIYKKLNIKFQKLNYYYHRREKNISTRMKLNDICWHGY